MSREIDNKGSKKIYYQVFNGAFRTKVQEGHAGALERINKKNVKVWEREVGALAGKVENIVIEDSDYGKQIKITLDANEQGNNAVLSFGTESKDGRDILKKLPAVDFNNEVCFTPYRYTPEGEAQEKSGITVTQENEDGDFTRKIGNYFFDPEKKMFIHDFPTINWDEASESERKIYKIRRDEFLVKYAQQNILPKFAAGTGQSAQQGNTFSSFAQSAPKDSDDIASSIPF